MYKIIQEFSLIQGELEYQILTVQEELRMEEGK